MPASHNPSNVVWRSPPLLLGRQERERLAASLVLVVLPDAHHLFRGLVRVCWLVGVFRIGVGWEAGGRRRKSDMDFARVRRPPSLPRLEDDHLGLSCPLHRLLSVLGWDDKKR